MSATTVAVLLVAGVGSRLRERSGDRPKCLVEVGGRSLLDRAVRALEAHGVRRVVLATGYREDLLREAARRLPVSVTFCPNARYDRTQNAVSLALCAEAVGAEAFFKLDGDLLFDPEVLPRLDSCPAALAVAVDGVAPVDEEAMKVRAGPDRRITAFGKSIALASAAGESIGIERIAASAARPVLDALVRSMNAGNNDLYYEDVYTELLTDGLQATAVEVGDLPWAEIDTPEDLDRAELSFAAPAG